MRISIIAHHITSKLHQVVARLLLKQRRMTNPDRRSYADRKAQIFAETPLPTSLEVCVTLSCEGVM